MRYRTFLTAFFAAMVIVATAQPQRHKLRYEHQDSVLVANLLYKASRMPANTNWMLHFGRELRGLPYVAHTLENNPGEKYLIVNLRELDCTTFTENVLAMSLCMRDGRYGFFDFTQKLDSIRYNQHDGYAEYPARLHYFTSWIIDNLRCGFLKAEIQSPNPPFTAVQTINVDYMTTHPDRYSMLVEQPSWIPEIRRAEEAINGQQYRYIPQAKLNNTWLLRNTVRDGDIIAIITNIKGLDTQHIGIAAWHADGLHLLNASSLHHKVIEEPMTLRQYLYRHKTMPGIRIIRPNL